ncbi:hypothetical protein PIB30_067091 [Stylosanthes scabra]|uniref:Uncharacterized protein n=1 Tax=Stylosanthes scabra TaxID=79078 RepID=A0ABU6XN92_9FABA|nr:hypothetical protein [Stylosanthes scabra]
MKAATQRALTGLFALVIIYLIMCSVVSVNCESRSNPIDRLAMRKLLAHASFSTSVDKLNRSYEASQKSVDPSLKKAPKSNSNPTHNR